MNYKRLYIRISDCYPGNHEIATTPGEYALPIIRAIQHPISVKKYPGSRFFEERHRYKHVKEMRLIACAGGPKGETTQCLS